MKKFRFETIHLVLMGMILFGLLALCVRVIGSQSALIMILFMTMAFVIALLYYQKMSYELTEAEQIDLLNSQSELSLKTLLDQMPVGVVKFDLETDAIDWYNPYAKLIFSTTESGDLDLDAVAEVIAGYKNATANHTLEIGGNRYATYIDMTSGIFYFFDSSRKTEALPSLSASRPVIGVISVDNYDDIIDDMMDSDVSQLNSFIATFISKFSQERHIFYRRVDMDRFYFFTNYAVLDDLMSDKFQVLEQFRAECQERKLPLTLSMGISFGDDKHNQIGAVALQNLNIALVRGGDQVVVKENDDQKELLYFGGGTVSTVKRSRTRTRAMMTAISDKLKTVQSVYVVGHHHLDMDALGSALGMQFFASQVVPESYVVYNPDELSPDISRALSRIQEDGQTSLISIDEALPKIDKHSLLIMVDHSKLSLTLSRELYDRFTEVIVVDHHRRDEDFPKNAVLTFIESGASSASELVTELIQFQAAKTRLTKLQASILMAGIMLDTKNFSTRVTSRTFDVASYLRTLGSDSIEIQSILATDFDEYRLINQLILSGERIGANIIVASGADQQVYSNVIASKAADAMLAMANIEATFVIFKNSQGKAAISARSRSKINVQRIMEKLGGGGHFNLAACQIEGMTVTEAKLSLIETIANELIDIKE
ncbi:DHH family phosphoesterase [Streptococcus loxodontisalivarius]|nr:DHH family phosphoesterase [Streptococcus loxodontisalivarius]